VLFASVAETVALVGTHKENMSNINAVDRTPYAQTNVQTSQFDGADLNGALLSAFLIAALFGASIWSKR